LAFVVKPYVWCALMPVRGVIVGFRLRFGAQFHPSLRIRVGAGLHLF